MRNAEPYDEWHWGAGFWLLFGTILLVTITAFFVEYRVTKAASARADAIFLPTISTAPVVTPRRARLTDPAR